MHTPISKKITLLNQTTLESFNSPNESDTATIVKNFTDTGLEILGADFGFAWWTAESGNDSEKYILIYKSPGTPYNPNSPRESGGNRIAQESFLPVFVNSVKNEDYEKGHDVSPYMQSYIIVPICYKNVIYGNLVLCYKNSHDFSDEEKGLATALGNAAAQAITIRNFSIQERKTKLESEQQQLRFGAMIENSQDVIGLLNKDFLIIEISNSAQRMFGYEPGKLIDHNLTEFIHPNDAQIIQNQMQKILAQPNVTINVEARYRHHDGDWHWLEASAVNKLADQGIQGVIINIRDISQRKEAEEIIKKQALQDPLTGLANRKEFSIRFEQTLEQAKRNNQQFALMFLDMDHFKDVNDTLGHEAGDNLLQAIATKISSCLRAEDVVARFGGDEFLILINGVHSSKDAILAAEKILKTVNQPTKIADQSLQPSVSIGVAIYPQHGLEIESLKKNADTALYQAKGAGKNRFSLYEHT